MNEPEHWWELANCHENYMTDDGVDMFFPEKETGRNASLYTVMAKQLCYGDEQKGIMPCPVRETCLEVAMRMERQGQRIGVWGGLTPEERKNLHKRLKGSAADGGYLRETA